MSKKIKSFANAAYKMIILAIVVSLLKAEIHEIVYVIGTFFVALEMVIEIYRANDGR